MTRQNKCKYINLDCIEFVLMKCIQYITWWTILIEKQRNILQPDYILQLNLLMTKTENGQRINPEHINYIVIYYARNVICVIQHVK